MDTRPYKVLLRLEDGSVDVVSDQKSLKFTISPDGALDGWVRLTGEPFDTSALEVVFDDADALQMLNDAMKALEFYVLLFRNHQLFFHLHVELENHF